MKLKINQIELFYQKSGKGAPLILLHGNGESHQIFDKFALKLAEEFTVYALDSRNHGESSQTDCYDYDVMADDVIAFMEELHLPNANIIGFSDGAIIALKIGMKRPELLAKLVLMGINLKPEDFTKESLDFARKHYQKTKDPLFKLMLEQPQIELEELKAVQTHTLVIGGEHDIFKPELYPTIVATLPRAELLIVEDHGHDDYIVGKDFLAEDVLHFLMMKDDC